MFLRVVVGLGQVHPKLGRTATISFGMETVLAATTTSAASAAATWFGVSGNFTFKPLNLLLDVLHQEEKKFKKKEL